MAVPRAPWDDRAASLPVARAAPPGRLLGPQAAATLRVTDSCSPATASCLGGWPSSPDVNTAGIQAWDRMHRSFSPVTCLNTDSTIRLEAGMGSWAPG